MEVWETSRRSAPTASSPSPRSRFSDPGPRLVDGVELIGHLLHPDLMDPPGNTAFTRLRSPAPRTAQA